LKNRDQQQLPADRRRCCVSFRGAFQEIQIDSELGGIRGS
jgi:hypothetical protein